LGDLRFAEGDLQAAGELYRQALDLKEEVLKRAPDIGSCNIDPAWFLATCPDPRFRDPRRAVALAQEAVKLTRRENGDYLNTLGVAQYRKGEWKAAVASLTEAQRKRGDGDASDWLFLAMAHWQLKEKEQARTCFERAVKLLRVHEYEPEELGRFRGEAAELLGIQK
jgi:uncharacterized protein HemY